MKWNNIKFEVTGKDVIAVGFSDLDGHTGILSGDGMAFFFGSEKAFYVANIKNGILRQFSSANGPLLVDEREIDFNAIARDCHHGFRNAASKAICYAGLNRYDGYKDGLCAISWMLYPDGRYFADEDGFGMEDNDEENVYDAAFKYIVRLGQRKRCAAAVEQLLEGDAEIAVYRLKLLGEDGLHLVGQLVYQLGQLRLGAFNVLKLA